LKWNPSVNAAASQQQSTAESPLPDHPAGRLHAVSPPAPATGLTWYRWQRRALHAVLKRVWLLWHFLLRRSHPVPPAQARARFDRRFLDLLELDLRNVEAGRYPRELLFQFPLRGHAALLLEGLRELWPIWRRSQTHAFDDLPGGLDLERYPAYYRRTFHWQSDGWFSLKSARLYDLSVDLLFLGAMDAMRRMALPLIVEAAGGRSARILDVACGNGRFLRQLHATLPRAGISGLELSPFYLEYAREQLVDLPGLELREGNAEAMPFAGGEFDVVTCFYLFHELPRAVRRKVVGEMRRVLRPGGRLVLCDSLQRRDCTPDILVFLDWFPALYHEPFYADYTRDDLEDLLVECGFEVEHSGCYYFSKVVAARLPAG
jgi:ubiquinone/menaquinone biosynthesis C-methylase UbiE